MSLVALLDHTCDIFHLARSEPSPGFGLPSAPSFSYPAVPDVAAQRCHFTQGGTGGTINTFANATPKQNFNDRVKLTLPIGVDVRLNDRIRDNRTGFNYIAEQPRTVRNHHIYVYVSRDGTGAAV